MVHGIRFLGKGKSKCLSKQQSKHAWHVVNCKKPEHRKLPASEI